MTDLIGIVDRTGDSIRFFIHVLLSSVSELGT